MSGKVYIILKEGEERRRYSFEEPTRLGDLLTRSERTALEEGSLVALVGDSILDLTSRVLEGFPITLRIPMLSDTQDLLRVLSDGSPSPYMEIRRRILWPLRTSIEQYILQYSYVCPNIQGTVQAYLPHTSYYVAQWYVREGCFCEVPLPRMLEAVIR